MASSSAPLPLALGLALALTLTLALTLSLSRTLSVRRCARVLLDFGGTCRGTDSGGFTPLWVACARGQYECARSCPNPDPDPDPDPNP